MHARGTLIRSLRDGTRFTQFYATGVEYEQAAVAFGCNPATMRKHYIALDEVAISDRVMDRIQNGRGEKNGENQPACQTDTTST